MKKLKKVFLFPILLLAGLLLTGCTNYNCVRVDDSWNTQEIAIGYDYEFVDYTKETDEEGNVVLTLVFRNK